MRGERGQASVEWVGALLLIAISLGALARLSDRVEAPRLATAGLRATKCALAGCERGDGRSGSTTSIDGVHRASAGNDGARPSAPDARAVTPPPLVSPPRHLPPRRVSPPAVGGPGSALSGRGRPRFTLRNPIPPRMRARVGGFWRRAWVACFAYERVRYGLLHPENHRQVVPLRDVVQMTNDCLSPFDFARDWEHFRP